MMRYPVSWTTWILVLVCAMVFLVHPVRIIAQEKIFGQPYLHQFNVDQYQAHEQNWDIVQDDKGLMYFGNGDGLLIFNGTSWELLEMPGQTMVQSLAKDINGRIYLGAYGHFGYLEYDPRGSAQYINLASSLTDSIDITRVFTTICLDSSVYFQTPEAVFRYTPGKKIKVWQKGRRALGVLFEVNGALYLKEHYKGISRLVNDDWEIIPGSERFGPVFVHFMIAGNNHEIVLDGGDSLWVFNGKDFKYFPTSADEYLKTHKIYCAQILDAGGFLIGTVNGGIIHLDNQGNLKLILADEAKLNSLNIRKFYQDTNGDIWVAMDVGLALLEYPAPEKIFRFNSPNISFTAFSRYHGVMYVASDAGLWKLSEDKDHRSYYSKVRGMDHKIWNIDSIAGRLIIATEFGLYSMQEDESLTLLVGGIVPGFTVSRYHPGRVYIFRSNGISLLNFNGKSWSQLEILPEFSARTRGVVEISPEEIWLDTDWTELWRVSFSNPDDFLSWNNPVLEKIDSSNNLPSTRGTIYGLNHELYFVPSDLSANYLWNDSSQQFTPILLNHKPLGITDPNAVLWEADRNGNLFYVTDYGSGYEKMSFILNQDDSYQPSGINLNKILNDIGESIRVEKEGIWFGGFSTIVYRELKSQDISQPHHALVNKVLIYEDSILVTSIWNNQQPSIQYKKNRLVFDFSTTDFASAGQITYQTFLEGEDLEWSGYSKNNSKEYYGLEPGRYTFKVRGLNRDNIVSEEAAFAFTIIRPWYREWWAYVLYVGGVFSSLLGAAKWRNRELLKEKERLENIIKEHTRELEQRNLQLQDKSLLLQVQAEKLTELDELKTNLFANISHEFRTPLTLIKAPVEQVEKDPGRELTYEEVSMIRRNSDRLLRLVNQLLDLAKIDARSLKLDLTEGDLFRFLRMEASSFSSLASQKYIDYQIKIPNRQLWAAFDRDKLETIVYNLLNNAFKFTPPSGTIILSASFQWSQLEITVEDDGEGIAEDQIKYIFDRFYQIKEGKSLASGGTGIGLALCKELAELMEGKITVTSRPGEGSKFSFIFPLREILSGPKSEVSEIRSSAVRSGYQQPEMDDLILIVEDHQDMRQYLASVLSAKYPVIEASNGREGLDKAILEIPDLVITDTMMPLMDGHELVTALKGDERTSHVPVLMLTAKATLDNKLESLYSGADLYLTKPFNTDELLASIQALLVERKRLRKSFSRQMMVLPREIAVSSLDQQFLERVLNVLELRYADSAFGVPQMQQALAMSKTQLHRKLKAISNQAPGEFLRNFRLQRAAQILAQKGESVTQVAYAVGFENIPYFTKCFKELFGVPPSQYSGSKE